MNFLRLGHGWWIFILLGIFLWGLILFLRIQKKESGFLFFTNNRNYDFSYGWILSKNVLYSIGMVFLGIALLSPAWGVSKKVVQKKGLDIIFALDVSKSMNALDFSDKRQLISRLDAAKYLVENFVNKRESDRFGLVIFAGESFTASPLTFDYQVFFNFLKSVSSDDIGKQGTDLASALENALSRLETQSEKERSKAIVLISDGDETIDSQMKNMAKIAQEKNIPIFVIGLGSEEGKPIPDGQDGFGRIYYKKYKGETVLAKINEATLKQIAKIGNGDYFHAEDYDDIFKLSKKLDNLPQSILKSEENMGLEERYGIFVFWGLIFVFLGIFLSENQPKFLSNLKFKK